MANDLLEKAPFLSVAPPPESIIDYSQKLTDSGKAALEAQCHNLGYQAKVVILPSDFSPGSMSNFDHFCRALAVQWHTTGNRFLLIVDLKAHNVRGLCGKDLESLGVKSDYISTVVLKGEFVSHMKAGDLEGAIKAALNGVQAKVLSYAPAPSRPTLNRPLPTPTSTPMPTSTSTLTPNSSSAMYAPPPNHGSESLGGLAGFCLVQIVIVLALIAYLIFGNHGERKARRMYDTLTNRLVELYEKAGAIGQASEYLDTKTNAELAKRVSDFFNRLALLSTAQNELERLKSCNSLSCAIADMRRTAKMSEMLLMEVRGLESEVGTATGASEELASAEVKNKFWREADEAVQKEDNEAKEERQAARIQIDRDQRFRRPGWAYEPSYYQRAATGDPWFGVREYMVSMNQMQTGNMQVALAEQLNAQQSYYQWMQDHRDENVRASGSSKRYSNNNRTNTNRTQQNPNTANNDTSWGGGSSADSGSSDSSSSGSDFSGGDGGASW